MKFKEFLNEVITPENLNIKISDVDELNKLYNKKDIYFTQNDGPKSGSYGNYSPTGRIEIQVPKNADLNVLNSVVSHELLHKEQDKRSNGNYGKWITKYGTGLNNYIARFNDRVDTETATQKEFDKIKKMQDVFKYGNDYELMAYAFQFVKVRNELNVKSPSELIKFIDSSTEVPVSKKLKKYVAQYWLIKDQI